MLLKYLIADKEVIVNLARPIATSGMIEVTKVKVDGKLRDYAS